STCTISSGSASPSLVRLLGALDREHRTIRIDDAHAGSDWHVGADDTPGRVVDAHPPPAVDDRLAQNDDRADQPPPALVEADRHRLVPVAREVAPPDEYGDQSEH